MQITTKEIADIVKVYNSKVMAKLDHVSDGLFEGDRKFHSTYKSQKGKVLNQYIIPFDKFDIVLEAFKHWGSRFQDLKCRINEISPSTNQGEIDGSKFASKIKIKSLRKIQNPELMSIIELSRNVSDGHLVYNSFGDYVKVETMTQLMVGVKQDSLFMVMETTPKFVEKAMGVDCVLDVEFKDGDINKHLDVHSKDRFFHVKRTKLSFSDITELYDTMMMLAP